MTVKSMKVAGVKTEERWLIYGIDLVLVEEVMRFPPCSHNGRKCNPIPPSSASVYLVL